MGLIPGLGRSPGDRKGYPFQYSGLENSVDCVVHGVTESRTSLSDFHFHSYFHDYILLMVLIYRVDIKKKKINSRISLVVWWIRIHLPMRETQVQSLV